MVDIAVIGAGAAGLVATRHLLRCGLKPIVLESSRAVGGSWSSDSSSSSSSNGPAATGAGPASTGLASSARSSETTVGTTTLRMPPYNKQRSSSQHPHQYPHQQHPGKMWNNLSPNLSKYTSCFSELPWDPDTPLFPSRIDMEHYLNQYASTYVNIPDDDDPNNKNKNNNESSSSSSCIQFGCTVTRVTPTTTSNSQDTTTTTSDNTKKNQKSYSVEWIQKHDEVNQDEDGDGDTTTTTSTKTSYHQRNFDGVVVATGFFSKPYFPSCLESFLQQHQQSLPLSPKLVIHSSEYKTPNEYQNQTVAIIGSSFSALEIASDVRLKAKHVVTILPTIPWVVPRYVPTTTSTAGSSESKSTTTTSEGMIPLDWILYQRNLKYNAPQIPEIITYDNEEMCEERHKVLQELVGTRKQLLSGLGIPSSSSSSSSSFSPPIVAISDDFLNLVISDKIQAIHGRLSNVVLKEEEEEKEKDKTMSLQLEDGTIVSGIDRIISCTGYRCSSLDDIFKNEKDKEDVDDDKNILKILEYNPKDSFTPLSLAFDTFHPQIPKLGFVGMYRGPYWGIMELQARMISELWSNQYQPSMETITKAMNVSNTIRTHTPRAQFPHFDYIGYMDTLANQLNLVPSTNKNDTTATTTSSLANNGYGTGGNFVFPVFYQEDSDLADRIHNEVQDHIQHSLDHAGDDMPKRVLSAIIGKWSFHRTITQMSGPPNPQTVTGEVKFSLEASGSSSINDDDGPRFGGDIWDTVLYREDGIFTLPTGQQMDVFREYEYIVQNNCMEIYFVENGKRAHLFLSLKFQPQQAQQTQQDQDSSSSNKNNNKWIATSDHLCIKDLYKGTFEVVLDGLGASEIIMTYRVKGPSKDYESVTYLRPSTQSVTY